ncbi:MAG TPA: L-seryl-tRNA(Sec) selenium transferase [Terracidiphilus sp.]|nr:L-seryl-tRNA(Sec) selenium transferase [Terracidiphilus sp.]
MAIHDLQHEDETLQKLFRELPSINEVLLIPACRSLLDKHPHGAVLRAAREALAALRTETSAGLHSESSLKKSIALLPEEIANRLAAGAQYSLRPVVNATGVILHTNLGRAPLSAGALRHVVEVAQDYCNLEFDLETGLRSRRDSHVESLVLRALGAANAPAADADRHGVIIVNNCAAATMLALNSLAEKSEVIVSRGELVEIGGGFRIPEILEKSGAILKEVGTTNRTRLADYESAIGPGTGLLLRVHRSNFSIEGFTERPSLKELVELSKRAGIPLFEDQGTGLLSSLERFGISGEPSLLQSFESGVGLIATSGDKLLGGPQCGILVGRIDLIDRIRKNPLLRALRVDKLTYAALEATLLEHLSEETSSIPVERMLGVRPEDLMRRCREITGRITSSQLVFDVVPVSSLVGGGTAPKATLQSCAISLRHASLPAADVLASLRRLEPPIIGRVSDDAVLLDLRTIPPEFDEELASLLSSL